MAFAAERFEDAQNAGTAALAVAPTDFDSAWNLLGAVLRTGQTEIGENYLRSWADVHPAADLACLEVELALELDDLDRAASSLSTCRESTFPGLLAETEGWYAARTDDMAGVDASYKALGIEQTASTRAFALYKAGDFEAALRAFEGHDLPDGPAGVSDRVFIALLHFELGEYAEASQGLSAVFEGDTWVQVEKSGAVTGILTKSGEDAYLKSLQDGAALKVRLHTNAGELAEAQAAVTQMGNTLGESDSLAAEHVRLLAVQGKTDAARTRLDGAYRTWPESDALLRTAQDLVVTHPQVISADVQRKLAAGPWQGPYNMAIAAAQREDWAGCVTALDGLVVEASFADHARTQLVSCATMGGELDRAVAAARTGTIHEEVLWGLALTLLGQEREAEARDVVVSLPDGSLIHMNVSLEIAVRDRRTEDAVALVEAGANSPAGLANLGVLLVDEGRTSEGKRYLKEGCKTLGDDAWCMAAMDAMR
ncbi:MAG: hypothetical protein GY913_06650 [Proteobacteria bacterium]|nr:hypothetical protein [Pseudomonadota bacterium]MCP4916585.1 hypothetical protein [Pseudomonadota bacterium]